MKTRRATLFFFLCALASVLCWAALTTTVTEDFEGTLADTDWRSGPADEIVSDGGNPGAFLRNPAAATSIPVIANEVPSVFTGPYMQMGVSDLGIDVNVFEVSGDVDNRPVSLGLQGGVYTGGTWVSCELIFRGTEVQQPGAGWKSYSFAVPAWKRHMPSSAVVYGPCANLPRDDVWNSVKGWVYAARFYVGDPGVSYETQIWDIGFDNARITIGKLVDHLRHDGRFASDGPVPMTVLPDPNE